MTSMSMTSNAITQHLLIELPKHLPCRVYRNNTGSAIPLATVRKAVEYLRAGQAKQALQVLTSCRTIQFSVPGAADITGILGPSGQRLEIEVKAGADRMKPDQVAFQRMIEAHGGLYVVARDVDQVIRDLAVFHAR